MDKVKCINDKERALADHVISGDGLKEALIKAGYSPKGSSNVLRNNAQKILKRPHVKAYVEERKLRIKEVAAKKFDITVEDQLRKLELICQDGLQIIPKLDKDGEETGITKLKNPDSVTRAIIVQNKMLGYDAPIKQEITGKDGEPLVPKIIIDDIK